MLLRCFLWYKDSELQVYGLQFQREIQALWRAPCRFELWTLSLLVEASIYRGLFHGLGPLWAWAHLPWVGPPICGVGLPIYYGLRFRPNIYLLAQFILWTSIWARFSTQATMITLPVPSMRF